MKLILLMVLLAGCAKPAPETIHLTFGTPGPFTLKGGTYALGVKMGSCTQLELEWAPVDGSPSIALPTTGTMSIELPKGTGYLNRVADCGDYVVDLMGT